LEAAALHTSVVRLLGDGASDDDHFFLTRYMDLHYLRRNPIRFYAVEPAISTSPFFLFEQLIHRRRDANRLFCDCDDISGRIGAFRPASGFFTG